MSSTNQLTGYFIIDESRPSVYTLYDNDNKEIKIDEGTNFCGTVMKFLEHGWTLHGSPWTYVYNTTDGPCQSYHCQVVVKYDGDAVMSDQASVTQSTA